MAYSDLPFASVENNFLRLDYLTTTGPRIVGLYANGIEGNLLAETPDVHWSTPHGEFYLRGGHRLWVAPESLSYQCPEDGLSVLEENDKIILKGSIDPAGLEKEISIRLEENCVHLSHRITWHGNEPVEFAAWGITQLRLGGMAILPQPVVNGLQPDRKLVFWPYAQVNDKRFELHDDLILLHAHAGEQAFKIGSFNKHGWIACIVGDTLFVKRFSVSDTQPYPDMGCNVEAYVKDVCIELETLGSLVKLSPQESLSHEETWEVLAGSSYEPTLESARAIHTMLLSNNS